jgi:hypothetical protein
MTATMNKTADGWISTGYQPRLWQSLVHRILKRFSILVVHRRAGKTVLAVNTLIDAALQHDNQKLKRGHFAYVAPFASQARQIAWDYLREFTKTLSGTSYNEQRMSCTLANGSTIRLYGADNPDSLRGLYFDGVVVDEVADIRPDVWELVIRPALSDRLGWCLFIGTPKGINLFSDIYFNALQDDDWAAAVLNCYQTGALDPDEIKKNKKTLTKDRFAQEFLCDFHAAVDDALISVTDVNAAMNRRHRKEQWSYAPRVMGVDVACYGNDRSVIVKRQGIVSHGHQVIRGSIRPMALASRVAMEADSYKPAAIFVDIGYAPGVADRLSDLGYPVIEVGFGETPADARFENKRAEMWWKLADWIKGGALPNDQELITDLCALRYNLNNRRGKIQLESKDDLRKRGLPSPDLGDAYAMTFAEELGPEINDVIDGYAPDRTAQADHEYHPY